MSCFLERLLMGWLGASGQVARGRAGVLTHLFEGAGTAETREKAEATRSRHWGNMFANGFAFGIEGGG